MKKFLLVVLLALAMMALWWNSHRHLESLAPISLAPSAAPEPSPMPSPVSVPEPVTESVTDVRERVLKQLEEPKPEPTAAPTKKKTVVLKKPLPSLPPVKPAKAPSVRPSSAPAPILSPQEQKRAEGRKSRSILPLGLALKDNVAVYDAPGSKTVLYVLQTGDFLRVFPDTSPNQRFRLVQPGLDIRLVATTNNIEVAGMRLPDQAGWVESALITIFQPDQAKDFLDTLEPVTLGEDPNFSTLDFYERAMRNPDPVVHRVIGPRLITLAALHEDYISSWPALIRDRDSKIRSFALSKVRGRGVANSRTAIDDLVTRLAELTRVRAVGEQEEEALLLLEVLKLSRHPSVPLTLASFSETWRATQGERLNTALQEIVGH